VEIREEIRKQGTIVTLPPISSAPSGRKLSSGLISIEKARDIVDNV
jgi:hypothetical protein